MTYYPMKLSYITKSPLWGGTRLLKGWGKQAEQPTVGESWELTVRENGMCCVENGAFAGRTLAELIGESDGIMGKPSPDGFPLLIKLIDAQERLSVQVHPDDSYAERVENDRGKTEMWYIVEADEGAEIICGLADGTTRGDFADAVRAGDPERVLQHRKVQAGEAYFIPAGLPHAIGKGILIAEIQQNCDLTYRVYDYNRRQPDGSLRQLQVKKALEVVRPYTQEEINAVRYSGCGGVPSTPELLADCCYFRVRKLTAAGEIPVPDEGGMRHLLCLSGSADLLCNGVRYHTGKGDSYLLPAAMPTAALSGNAVFLLTSLPYHP